MKYLLILLTIIGVGAYVSAQAPVGAPNLPPQAQVFGGIDVALERVENVGGNQVATRQIGNLIETTFPWKDQPGFKVVYNLGESTPQERAQNKRKKEVITETVDFGDGGYKVDILLNEKPATNVFCYDIQNAEDYDFFYQPELTPEEIAEGLFQPENIIGSYAVYHKTLKNHKLGEENYATGKVMHIPRPQVWSLSDETTKEWAELSYASGELCVTAPQTFLDMADYPVRIDPTFGYTSIGATKSGTAAASSDTSTRHGLSVSFSDTPANLTQIDVALALFSAGSETVDVTAFLSDRDSGGTGSHGELDLKENAGVTYATTTSAWYSFTMPGVSLSNDTYVINAVGDATDISAATLAVLLDNIGGSNDRYFESFTGASSYTDSQEDPWTKAVTTGVFTVSMYATYTATAEGEATTTANSAFTGDIIISGDTVLD